MKTQVHFVARCGAALVALSLIVHGLTCARAADANPPDRISYQGNVVDANGVPLASSTPRNYDTIFRIYDASTAGNIIWSEQQTITVDNGLFSVLLGEGSAVGTEPRPALSGVFSGATPSDRYIGITVKGLGGTDTEIAPRLRLVTSPYAMLAKATQGLLNNAGTTVLTATSASGISAASALTVSGAVTATAFNLTGTSGLNANSITAGTISAARIPLLDASQITTGIFGVARIPSLDAAQITSGTFAAGRIPGLDASKITSGTLADAALSGNVAKLNSSPTFSGSVTAQSFSGNGAIPIGGIIMWSGAKSAIPSGWALCDGGTYNGKVTPNLTDRFVIGAGLNYAVGAAAGSATVTLSTANLPPHAHAYKDAYHAESNLNHGDGVDGHDTLASVTVGSGSTDRDNIYLFYRNMTSSNTGSGTAVNIMPPYYALCFIMRVQ